ncbi:MAG: lytic transglycosylase domain-containing protein [Myxococcaceae bacterium]
MKGLLPALVVVASLGVCGWNLRPLVVAPPPQVMEVEGVAPVRPPDFERIAAVLEDRAPGWGIELREHVALAISEESATAGLDPLLVLALIEVESEFRESATSVVGARGLMQVRPATLEWMARREGIKLSTPELQADPSLNVRLGVRYLKYLRELFGGRMDFALMAYNAGPNKLASGLRARDTSQWKNYVRAVKREYASLKIAHGESADWALASRTVVGDTAAR